MNDYKKIYIITLFPPITTLAKYMPPFPIDDNSVAIGPNLNSKRTVGWFDSLEVAQEVVKNNEYNLLEGTYFFALIEELEEGVYEFPYRKWFYKYNLELNKYEEIQFPEGFFMNNNPFWQEAFNGAICWW